MQFLNELWSRCQNQAQTAKLEKFSIRLCHKSDFDFWLSKAWPVDKIKKSLAINLHTGDGSDAQAWAVYGLTTEDFDYFPYVNNFSRDQYGHMDLKSTEVDAFYDPTHHLLRVYDFSNKRAAYIYQAGHTFTEWEMHSPFRDLWHYWALRNDAILIHSGIVSDSNVAILLPGAGGKGKSTTVLSCLNQGMKTTGDDYNLLYLDNGEFRACPLYGNVKLKMPKAGGLSFDFSVARDWASETLSYANKIIYYPPAQAPIWEISCPKLVAILCPEVPLSRCDNPEIKDMKVTELINSLVMSSIMLSPFMAKEYLGRTASLSRQMKHGKIHLSTIPELNVECIRTWLGQITGRG
jgi:hypothetical protein